MPHDPFPIVSKLNSYLTVRLRADICERKINSLPVNIEGTIKLRKLTCQNVGFHLSQRRGICTSSIGVVV
jgi:hypothetical protein